MHRERSVIKASHQDFSLFVKRGTRYVRTRLRRITTFVVIVTETDIPKSFTISELNFNTVYFRKSCSVVLKHTLNIHTVKL